MLLLTALAACERDGPSENLAYVVQISEVRHAPNFVACGGRTDIPFDFQFNVTMVNTTRDDVDVTNVGSGGVYLLGAPSGVGTEGLSSLSLPFTPLKLVARTGQGTTVVRIAGLCPPAARYGEIQVTLLVHTTAGTFATPPKKVALGF